MKKIMLLGGSIQQIAAIETAKKLGYYTVLCDFLTDNPGQYLVDKFYLVSTTDKEAVLDVAIKEKIDGVLAYASDPAAPTAAYVAEKLCLPTNPYKSVEILCNKDLYREFLKENGFNTPFAMSFTKFEDAKKSFSNFKLPVIIKPVDSSGSKGVSRIDKISELEDCFATAMRFSRNKTVIIEEFVEKFGYQVAGDGMVLDGELVFRCFANDHFNPKCENPFVPIAASFPYNMPEKVHNKIHNEIQRLITKLNMKSGTYNFDIRIDKDLNVYLMEIAPRSGGNYIPQIIQYATGVDLAEYAVEIAMGKKISKIDLVPAKGYYSYFAIHSLKNGVLKSIEISEEAKKCIVEEHIAVKKGDSVRAFTGANTRLGILIMNFENEKQMLDMMDNSEKWISVNLK